MPHINRIRVNNVRYNFGTQYYDDFIMRFSGKNTIYDLANGGGKSVLMLLLFQNLIPNCTLDDKQPIEKLFRTGEGSKTIHSLIEWNLSDVHIKDNFKYMLTGFCARKAGESGDENRDNASIEYFNYVIFYRNYNDNDLKNLPLQNGRERITYNGLKNYLRELERKDLSLSVKIFEKKSEYQRFISEYGLYESEWEIIRGINKTEGHVRTYFESNYKTTRKVVEDLLIEEIIQRSFANRYGIVEEDTMAQTLLDIKDKLIELSDKKSQISGYDRQQEIIEGFIGRTASVKNLYAGKENLEGQICRMYNTIMHREAGYNDKYEQISDKLEETEASFNDLARLTETAAIMQEKKIVEDMNSELDKISAEAEDIRCALDDKENGLKFKESANDYLNYINDKSEADAVRETILARRKDSSVILREAEELAGELFERNKIKLSELSGSLLREEQAAEAEKEVNTRLAETEKDLANKLAVSRYRLEDISGEYDNQSEEMGTEMRKLGIMLPTAISDELNKTNIEIENRKSDRRQLNEEWNAIRNESQNQKIILENKKYEKNELQNKKTQLEMQLVENKLDAERYEKINEVYRDRKIEQMLIDVIRQIAQEESRLGTIEKELDAYKNNMPVPVSEQINEICEYIARYHGDICIPGAVYLSRKDEETREELINRIPILPYSVVATGKFDSLVSDIRLLEMCHHNDHVCIIDEDAIVGSGDIISSENVIVSMEKKEYFINDNTLGSRIPACEEEMKKCRDNIARLYEYEKVIREDYAFVSNYAYNNCEREIEECNNSIYELDNEIKGITNEVRELDNRADTFGLQIQKNEEETDNLVENREKLVRLTEIYDVCSRLENEITKLKQQCEEYDRGYRKISARLKAAVNQADMRKIKIANIVAEKEAIQKKWDESFASYYNESVRAEISEPYETIVARLNGLISAIKDENSDLADKEKLLKNYENSMNRALGNIKYRDTDMDKLVNAYNNNELVFTGETELRDIKAECSDLNAKLNNTYRELDDIRSKRDKSEGGASHGVRQIEEKYGFYSEEGIKTNNLKEFIESREVMKAELQEQKKKYESELAAMKKIAEKQVIAKENLERIIQNGNIDTQLYSGTVDNDMDIYQKTKEISGEYDKFVRSLYEKKEEFENNKRMLMDTLKTLNAVSLAEEIDRSVTLPESVEETNELITRLKDTNMCIELEKSRISKGIEDMEKIKDNFENQCIQTCIRIKTELERLPKLSKISLEKENIPVIDLKIPYVPEETYKSRMSDYVDETATEADGMKTPEEKIKYIRSRLTWKRLFSVIVTDMNAIRLKLYKRERIAENSRFLPYEEAVGSTGQSQGIYIQFLIAIINYISSVNSRGADASYLKKVIFIDNPFGAAKDVYIWEPIFRLLKTNNVQLIVPARGATPAITGRFDVNYVLGQKLINGKQQTVVVDYFSNVDNSTMEYTTLSYEQTSMF